MNSNKGGRTTTADGNKWIRRFSALLLSASLVLFVVPVHAIDLGTAKAQGLVGETPSGYLGAVKPPSGEVKQLMQNINGKRKAQYQAIADKRGTTLQAVEALAGKQAMEKTPKGQYVKKGGKWVKN